MSRDPVYPVLAEKHLAAIERRLEFVLQKAKDCVVAKGAKEIIRISFFNPHGAIDDIVGDSPWHLIYYENNKTTVYVFSHA